MYLTVKQISYLLRTLLFITYIINTEGLTLPMEYFIQILSVDTQVTWNDQQTQYELYTEQ